jgi:hypothetical protein
MPSSRPSRREAPIDWPDLIRRFDAPDVRALVLLGSFARGNPNAFSDVDLGRFTAADAPAPPGGGSHLIDGRLVVVSDISPSDVERSFIQPEIAVSYIPGLRQARPLVDREGFFAALQARAHAFTWDAAMQERADAYANREMVGWIEEVHKGLAGLQDRNVGRLLDAEFGLSWGLNRLVAVQQGGGLFADGAVSDSDWFSQVEASVGPDTVWARLRRQVFGVTDDESAPTLPERVIAGLRLYAETAGLLGAIWTPKSAPLIQQTVDLIAGTLHRALRSEE